LFALFVTVIGLRMIVGMLVYVHRPGEFLLGPTYALKGAIGSVAVVLGSLTSQKASCI